MWKRLLVAYALGIVGAVSVVGTGCSNGGGSEPSLQTGRPSLSSSAVSSASAGKISAGSMRNLVPSASEFQRSLFSDGVLSLAEYESAKLGEIQCLKEAGLGIEGDTRPNGIFLIRFLIVSQGPSDPSRSAIAQCRKEYAEVVDMIWAEVSVPLVQDVIKESRRLMAECYDRNGLRVDEKPHDSLDPEIESRFRSCLAQVDTALNLGGVSYGVEGDGRPR
jgi:hypothetical protein